jgi:hypothetical protein
MKREVYALQQKVNLTPSEARILDLYLRIAEDGKFCASRKTIAEKLGLEVWEGADSERGPAGDNRTVRRANAKFRDLGILSWVSGNGRPPLGQANQYTLNINKIKELTEKVA